MPLPILAYYAATAAGGALIAGGYLVMPSWGDSSKTNAQVMGEGMVAGGEAIVDGVQSAGEAIGGVFSQSAENADRAADQDLATGSAVDACSTCPPPGCKNIIDGLKRKNYELKKEMWKYDPISDAAGGHPYAGIGGVTKYTVPGGHYKEMRQLQRGLRNDISRYNKSGCYQTASRSDKITLEAAQKGVNRVIDVPPGINPIPL